MAEGMVKPKVRQIMAFSISTIRPLLVKGDLMSASIIMVTQEVKFPRRFRVSLTSAQMDTVVAVA